MDYSNLFGTHEEIEEVLSEFRNTLGDGAGLFEFQEHIPQKPKTTLPLHTYFADIPSVTTAIERRSGDAACGASFIMLMYELLQDGRDWEYLSQVLDLERCLEMRQFEGQERGRRVRQLRDRFIEEFSDVSVLPPKTLRGKNHKRVFWSIITVDNMERIDKVVAERDRTAVEYGIKGSEEEIRRKGQ